MENHEVTLDLRDDGKPSALYLLERSEAAGELLAPMPENVVPIGIGNSTGVRKAIR